ncbi:hypothetical protein [Bacillus swezeyi]|uniref:Uncharacterized protein n=1 Tax=Bacillus swezeyi TaxID=1925020 RepID=A0A5M8RZ07_9BACI|nr:hypothetical protein [Bacillus swezeyi]KAA6452718.1 hypothetical protein DX927_00370 [Bacillus swezeyi]TYS38084.1 hypothetical protein FZC77_00290 [Bacillus swezeyi]
MGTDEYYKQYLEESLVKLKTRDLIEFVEREFPEEVNHNHEIHRKKIEALKSLSKTDLSAAIARLARIQRKFDHTKLWTIGAVFIGTVLVNLQILFKVNLTKISEENYINYLLYGIAALTVCFVLYRTIRKDKKISDTAAYLKDLIKQVKSDK